MSVMVKNCYKKNYFLSLLYVDEFQFEMISNTLFIWLVASYQSYHEAGAIQMKIIW